MVSVAVGHSVSLYGVSSSEVLHVADGTSASPLPLFPPHHLPVCALKNFEIRVKTKL